MDFIVPGFSQFIDPDRDKLEMPVRTDFSLFGASDPDVIPEANTPDGLIPNSYMENGIRKVIVWDLDEAQRYSYQNGQLKQIKEVF